MPQEQPPILEPVTYHWTQEALDHSWGEYAASIAGVAQLRKSRQKCLKHGGWTFATWALACYAGLRLWMLDERQTGFILVAVALIGMYRGFHLMSFRPRFPSSDSYWDRLERSGWLPGMVEPTTLKADPAGIHRTNQFRSEFTPWPAVAGFSRSRGVVQVRIKYYEDWQIPESAFPSEDAAHQWINGCERLRSAAPKGKPHPLDKLLNNRDFACRACGYNLRGILGGVCPECGWIVDRVD